MAARPFHPAWKGKDQFLIIWIDLVFLTEHITYAAVTKRVGNNIS